MSASSPSARRDRRARRRRLAGRRASGRLGAAGARAAAAEARARRQCAGSRALLEAGPAMPLIVAADGAISGSAPARRRARPRRAAAALAGPVRRGARRSRSTRRPSSAGCSPRRAAGGAFGADRCGRPDRRGSSGSTAARRRPASPSARRCSGSSTSPRRRRQRRALAGRLERRSAALDALVRPDRGGALPDVAPRPRPQRSAMVNSAYVAAVEARGRRRGDRAAASS